MEIPDRTRRKCSKNSRKLDKRETWAGLLEELISDWVKAREEFQELVIREEIKWRQKSRVNWLRSGDNNTKFFHSLANSSRLTTEFHDFLIEGSECVDQQRIENEIINYYKQLYSKNKQTAAWFSTWVGEYISKPG